MLRYVELNHESTEDIDSLDQELIPRLIDKRFLYDCGLGVFHLECSARLVENLHPSIQVPESSEPPKHEQQEQHEHQEEQEEHEAQDETMNVPVSK